MASQPAERARGILAAVAVLSAAGAFLSLRAVSNTSMLAARAIPADDLQKLAAYLQPLPDSGVALVQPGTTVVPRDPFGSVPAAQRPHGRPVPPIRPTSVEAGQWVVSSILLEGSRRSAILNNTWVTIGDAISGGAKVTAIEPDHVIVTDSRGIRHTVPIQGGE